MKYEQVNEVKRVQAAVQRQGQASLAEGFDKKMYSNPIWKKVDKSKWRTTNGMNLFQTHRTDNSYHVNEQAHRKNGNSKVNSLETIYHIEESGLNPY